MAEQRNNTSEEMLPRDDEDNDIDQDSVRSSDRDEEAEREGLESDRNGGYDEAVRGDGMGSGPDLDPDSPASENDRDQ